MSQKHRSKASAPCQASGIRGEYEAHGAEEFYQSQGSCYSNPHEQQLKIGFPRCFTVWKDKLPVPFVRQRVMQLESRHFIPSPRAHCWTLRAAVEKSPASSTLCFPPLKRTALTPSHTKRNPLTPVHLLHCPSLTRPF